MEAWPLTLPVPDSSFKTGLISGLTATGEIFRLDRNRTYPERDLSVKMILSVEQLIDLRTFYVTTLNYGNKLFTADWLHRLGFKFHRLKFKDTFSATRNCIQWDVTINLIIIAGVPFDGRKCNYWT